MNDLNSVWVRGRENRNKMVEALLESGYQVLIDLDKESELVNGVPSYLISYVDPHYSGLRFEAVNEEDGLVLLEESE